MLIERAALFRLPEATAVAGVRVRAAGIGDPGADSEAAVAEAGRAVRPMSPVGLRAEAVAGGFALSWIRRSREGWRWADAVDAPLAEEREHYRVTRTGAGLAPLTVDADAASFDYPAAQRAADAAAGAATVVFEVRQIGAGGASAPASIDLSIL